MNTFDKVKLCLINCHIICSIQESYIKYRFFLFVTINGMCKHMAKVEIKILQGSAVTQSMLGGLTIYPLVANFL